MCWKPCIRDTLWCESLISWHELVALSHRNPVLHGEMEHETMANVSTGSAATTTGGSEKYPAALAMVTVLFFFWGFVTVLNDILVPHLKSVFELNYTKVMLIQFAFFAAYFIFSIPSAKLIDAIGYKKTMVTGLVTMGLGAFLF